MDDWLNDVATQGLSWYRPAGYDTYKSTVMMGSYARQSLFAPVGASGQSRVSWLISEQGDDWAEYDLSFSAYNSYVTIGSGVTVLTIDEDNAYWIDISRDNGRLIRIMNGVSTVLATSASIELPHKGARSYLVNVRQTGSGIEISVDADGNGSVDLTYTDTDSTAISTFTAGGIGIHDDTPSVYTRLQFDAFQVDVITFAP